MKKIVAILSLLLAVNLYSAQVHVLVVAGAGGGAGLRGGGGAAGGMLVTTVTVTAGNYLVTVGSGGLGGVGNGSVGETTLATKGGDSIFDTIISSGGGTGGADGATGTVGGSGGGSGAGSSGAAGMRDQGNAGGNGGACASNCPAGGGGGRSSVGGNAADGAYCGKGAEGCFWNIDGFDVTGTSFAAGGGGGNLNTLAGGKGGSGIGGQGGDDYSTPAHNGFNGKPDTGSGGGGATMNGGNIVYGGDGGSGIVKIAYHSDGSDGIGTQSSGGAITTSGVWRVHTFKLGDSGTNFVMSADMAGGGSAPKRKRMGYAGVIE